MEYIYMFFVAIYLLGFSREFVIYFTNRDEAYETYLEICEDSNKNISKFRFILCVFFACLLWPVGMYVENNIDKF